MARLCAAIALLCAASVAAFIAWNGRSANVEAVGPGAPNQMALDADATLAGIQTTRNVSGTSEFTAAIWVTQVGSTPYAAYAWEFEFPDGALSFEGGVTENSAATGLNLCLLPVVNHPILHAGYTAVRYGGCLGPPNFSTTYVGQTTTFRLKCLTDGTFNVRFPDLSDDPDFGTTLISRFAANLDTGTSDMTVVCSNTAGPQPTDTPVPTPTPLPVFSSVSRMALDAVGDRAGLEATRNVWGTGSFAVGVWITDVSALYQLYQWQIQFPSAALAFDGGTIENTSATGIPNCFVPQVDSVSSTTFVFTGSCNGGPLTGPSSFTGQSTTFNMHCRSDGSFQVILVAQGVGPWPGFGTTLGDRVGNSIVTQTTDAVINCAGTGLSGIAKDTGTEGLASGFFSVGNLWLCKPLAAANPNLPPPGSFSGAGEPACGAFDIAELARAPKDIDTCNDDDDHDGRPCAGDPAQARAPWQAPTDGCLDVAEDYIPGQTTVDCDTSQGGMNGTGEQGEGLGAIEFQVKFDDKLFQSPTFDCTVAPDGAPAILGSTGRVVQPQVSVITENWVMFGCVSKNPQNPVVFVNGANIDGAAGVLGTLHLKVQGDLLSRMRPAKDNGVVTNLLDENCELADTLGKPYNGRLGPFGANEAPSGGLTNDCKDAALTIRMLEGDVNLDCMVDVRDDQAMAFRYGQFFGQLNYNRFFDLEPNVSPDFDIDIKDLQTVFGRNGSTCAHPIPSQPPQNTTPDP